MMKTLFIAALVASVAPCLRAQVLNPGIDFAANGTQVSLTTVTYPGYSDSDTVILDLNASNRLVPIAESIGGGLAWYVSQPGVTINATYISSQARFADNWGDAFGYTYAPAPLLALNQSIFLAFWRDADFDSTSSISSTGALPPSDIGFGDQIGWAELTRTSSGITLTASAMDLSGNGIAVGSFASIPEPADTAAILLGAALAGTLFLRYRRNLWVGSW